MKKMVTVNKDTNTVYIDGGRYALSTSEIMLLEFWYSNPGVISPANGISKNAGLEGGYHTPRFL
ncbi:TPA: hypothetical protein ACU9K7_003232 [Salmonella enterica]